MKRSLIISGFGGQGLMFLGKLICKSAVLEGKYATHIPSYGAEMRGGTAHCYVCVSDSEISSPYIEKPDILIVMNQPSLEKFESKLKKGGILIGNKSLINTFPKRKDVKVYLYPLNEMANKIGDVKVANLIALGILLKKDEFVKKESVIKILKETLDSKLLELNLKALELGWEIQ